jgi:hypothetical protein
MLNSQQLPAIPQVRNPVGGNDGARDLCFNDFHFTGGSVGDEFSLGAAADLVG